MEDDALDNIDATIATLREAQSDETTTAEAAEAARLAELALMKYLDTLLAEAMRAPPKPLPSWMTRPDDGDGDVLMPA